LLCEGKYAELMALNPRTGSDVVTFVWWSIMVGNLVGSVCVGPMADAGHIKALFWLAAPLAAQVCYPTTSLLTATAF
jgi:hypothetical protein